jgi:hypothetical protein
MAKAFSLIGPDVFMDQKGLLYKKASEDYVPLKSKYTEAEERYVKKHLQKKGRGMK